MPAPANLVGWWAGDNSTVDFAGTNNGALVNGAAYGVGQAGSAFAFNGNYQVVEIADSPALNPTGGMTLECWFNLSAYPPNSGGVSVVEKGGGFDAARQYEIAVVYHQGQWVIRPNIWLYAGITSFFGTTPVQTNTWYHVAQTYDGAKVVLYVNGNAEGSLATNGAVATSAHPLWIGGDLEGPWSMSGLVDEVSLYNRALSATEVETIYNAGSAGKCKGPIPPTILTQPTDQTVAAGRAVSFSATVTGAGPVSWQWLDGHTAIAGATNPTFTIPAAQLSDAGIYRVLVTNQFGSALSSNAALQVNSPPVITTQPASQLVQAGGNASFAVGISSPAPAGYQWHFDGSNLAGASASTLTVSNAQTANVGAYSVTVTNAFGSVTSSIASLFINAVNCTPLPSGAVAWWAGEGSAADSVGTNPGTMVNGAGFGAGIVDQAFSFNGNYQVAQVPSSPALNPTNAISLECWFNLNAYNPSGGFSVVEKGGGYDVARQYEIAVVLESGQWVMRPNLWLPGGIVSLLGTTPIQTNTWYHTAMTYDGANLALYVNGNPEGSTSASGPIITTTHPLWIGGDLEGQWNLNGLVDEVSLYNRALGAAEVLAIYNAGSSGKCEPFTAPLTSPVLQITTDNVNYTLSWPVWAAGFNLEANPGLIPGNWTAVTATPITNSSTLSVTLPISSVGQFFRLHHP